MAYTFDNLFAADPSNPTNVAANASILLYDPADPTKAPVTITDPTGSPIPNPVTVNKNGFGPAMQHATLDRLAWEGGGFSNFITSYEGIKNEAVSARTAAQEAAATAGADAAAIADAAIGTATDEATAAAAAAEAAADAADASALAAANSAALVGAPADTAIATAINAPGSATKTALSATYATKAEAAHTTYTSGAWTPGSKVQPLAADQTRIFGTGSSSMGNMRTEIEDALAGQTWGATYTSWAEAGERFEHALARAGIVPARITFPSNTIPASGSVTVTTDLPTGNFMRTYAGTVAGVEGTLSLASPVFTFTRTTPGTAVTTTAGAEFIPAVTVGGVPQFPAFRDAVAILDTGKNNTSDLGAANRINAALDLLVDWLVPKVKTHVVLGQFADTNSTLTQKKNVAAVNADRAAKYGSRFIDLHAYVTGSQIWTDTGVTPTATDLNQQAKGEKPSSLSSDDLHLNPTAELAVVNKLIMPKLAAALGKVFYGPNPVVASDSFAGPNMTSLSGRVTDSALGGEMTTWTADANFASVTSGQVVTGTNTSMAALPSSSADVEFSVKVATVPTASSMNVMARAKTTAADINNDAYRATLAVGGSLILARRSAASTATISTGSYTAANGDTIGVRCVGNQISLLKNGAVLETVTDANIANGPWAGVSVVGTTGAVLDDVKLRNITNAGLL